MSGWSKLFSSIVTSSVWCESDATVRVWIAMLATADSDGVVEGSIPGFANLARVSVEQMRVAVEKLSSPDPDSRTPDHGGRRIEAIEGGWLILNYLRYRERAQEKEGSRAPYYRTYRARKKAEGEAATPPPPAATPPTPCNTGATIDVARNTEERRERQEAEDGLRTTDSEAPASAACAPAQLDLEGHDDGHGARKAMPKKTATPKALAAIAIPSWSKDACDDWTARFDGTPPGGVIGRHLKPLVTKHTWALVRPAWRNYLAQTEGAFASPARFAQTFGIWNGTAAPAMGKQTIGEQVMVEAAAFIESRRKP